MEEKKLTDEEIVKDIERSTGMPSYWKTIVLDFIHRLQSENEKLGTAIDIMREQACKVVSNRRKCRICDGCFLRDVETDRVKYKAESLRVTIAKQKTEIERLTKERDIAGYKNNSLIFDKSELETKNKALQKQVEAWKARSRELEIAWEQSSSNEEKLQKQVDELKEQIMNLKTAMIDRVAMKSYDTMLTTPDDVEEIFGDAYESEFNKFLGQAVKDTAKEIQQLLHDLGGCDATDEWSKGWDKAIDTAYEAIKTRYGVEVE